VLARFACSQITVHTRSRRKQCVIAATLACQSPAVLSGA
jgi:hypothetical protein